ncbi:glycosyltransferase family 2 protein [Colwellia sp. MB02u-10]|uniref:glycosyltransferase n=1 Tax=Colwellia sp. MB02u-10 TaxID=2759828 RepID=UPI0015F60275|nr:glycosyltransferase family 2 protein [Colwellia sp. MB02u-10]MBA6341494.1 glycosyltransferase family 2 protein [Colwellia sp. MB02u-10]
MDLSIIFATYHSEEILQKSLECYCLIDSKYQWELIIVDNANREETRKVIDLFKDKLPIHFIKESDSGKNNALNKAIPHAKSDLIWFTDNDILPPPDLVDIYVDNCQKYMKYDVFGGNILPDTALPEWIDTSSHLIKAAFGILKLGDENLPVDASSFWGGNMLIRKRVLDSGIKFGSKVCSSGNNHIMGNETELLLRLEKDGYLGFFLSNATVKHQIRQEQLTVKWLIRRAYNAGGGIAYNTQLDDISTICGMPKYFFRILIIDFFTALWGIITFRKKLMIISLMKLSNTIGRLKQFFKDR